MKTTRELAARKRVGLSSGALSVNYVYPTSRGTWEYGCSCSSCDRTKLSLSWREVQIGKCPDCVSGVDLREPEPVSRREEMWKRIKQEEAVLSSKYHQLEALFEGV